MDLVRLLLMITEEAEQSFDPRTLDIFSEYSQNELIYHIKLLESKELIDINVKDAFGGDCVGSTTMGVIKEAAVMIATKLISQNLT